LVPPTALLGIAGSPVAHVGIAVALVGAVVSLVGGPLALVGEVVASISGLIAFVGAVIAFISSSLPRVEVVLGPVQGGGAPGQPHLAGVQRLLGRPGPRLGRPNPGVPVRIPATTAAGPELLRSTAARHSGGPHPPRIATAVQLEVPKVSNKAMLVMVHRLDTRQIQVTVLNFSDRPIAGRVTSQHLAPGAAVIDMVSDQVIAEVDHAHAFAVSLEPHQGMSLLTDPAPASGRPGFGRARDDCSPDHRRGTDHI
jgi:hypothetical protein